MKLYKVNVSDLLRMAKKKGIEGVPALAEICGTPPQLFTKRLNSRKASLPDIMKLSKALEVPPYFITCGENTDHVYWYVCEEEYPVDVSFCAPCKYWAHEMKWCTYFEHTGEMKPNNSIVVHDDGRHTCICREIGEHNRKVSLGVVTRRRRK